MFIQLYPDVMGDYVSGYMRYLTYYIMAGGIAIVFISIVLV